MFHLRQSEKIVARSVRIVQGQCCQGITSDDGADDGRNRMSMAWTLPGRSLLTSIVRAQSP